MLEADTKSLSDRTYNMSAFSCTPKDVEKVISEYYPNFKPTYESDFRQSIADSWPASIDYSLATKDWGFNPKYVRLQDFSRDLLEEVSEKVKVQLTNNGIPSFA